MSESGYYVWKDRPTAPRELRRIWLAGEIVDVHKASGGTYGATRVRGELIHGRGIHVGQGAVELIMRRLGIKGLPTRRLPRGATLAKITSLDLVDWATARSPRPEALDISAAQVVGTCLLAAWSPTASKPCGPSTPQATYQSSRRPSAFATTSTTRF